MSKTVQVIQKKISDDISRVEGALLGNRAENLAHYRYLTGQLRGLTVALNCVKDLEAQANQEDWED